MQKALFSLLYVCFLLPVRAQYEEKDFTRYTVKEGLSDNYITGLQQDDRGYMWIGTDIGLNRFDGHTFKRFFQGTRTLPLLSGSIGKLKSMGPRQMGIVSRGGFQLLNTNDLSVKNYTIPDTTAFTVYRNAAWDALELPGKSYAVTTASGFYVFDASGKLNFRHDAYVLKDIGQKRILYGRNMFRFNDNEYLAYVEENGLAYYDAEKKLLREISKDEKQWAHFYPVTPDKGAGFMSRYQFNENEFIFIHYAGNRILYYNKALDKVFSSTLGIPRVDFSWESKITPLNDSSFLLNAGYSGFYLFHINRTTGKIKADPKKFLDGHKIQFMYLDKDKRLWVGTSKGLLKQKLATPVLHSYSYLPSPSDSLTGGLSCAYRYKDKLYIGRFSLNKGLVIADTATKKATGQIEFYGKNTPWNEIRSIQLYHPDTLWVGTNAGLLWLDTKTHHYGKVADENKNVPDLYQLNILAPARKDGYAWMLSHLEGVVARYHIASRSFTFYTSKTKPALPFDKVKSIAYDAYGDVWIGGHSLTRWNTQKQSFDTLISVYSGPNKFEDDIVALVADDAGSLWLHNAANGLLEYRIKEKNFVNYTRKDGLPSDVFYGFSPVINDRLWIAGHDQLTGFNTQTKKMIIYDYQDGLPDDKPSGRYLYYDPPGGLLYLFNQHVLSTLPVNKFKQTDSGSILIIEELSVNNTRHIFYPKDGLRLNPVENNLSLHFSIIDFESGNNYQFAYTLNETGNWTDLGGQRTINLSGLSPGNYTIRLKGTGKSGQQTIQQFSFLITPPYWKTTWFLSGLIFLVAAFLYYFYRRRIKQVRERANIDKQLSQAEMKALHAQMNPHFIFNSLNSIREMILNNENKEASHFLSKFAHLIRMTLDQSGQSFISLRNTMEYLTRYMEMEQIRNSHFTCRILADDELDLDETVLPPMLIQPFVENAIWHGTTGKQKNININIDFKKEGNQLVGIIEDNGIGISRSLENKKNGTAIHQPVGIENVNNRIRLLNEKYNIQSSVRIEDKNVLPGYTETGTVVTLRIPLKIKEE